MNRKEIKIYIAIVFTFEGEKAEQHPFGTDSG